ncbi:MAG: chloramphenicol acetyltransferase [Muribaculaceae bacterium]|nr:chloramphenicol acetyltransferase [Muribaculaceae bacterium]
MMRIIDMATWRRRDNFRFFQGFANSWYSVTTEFECSQAFKECKDSGDSFFIRYLYAVVRAANEVEAFRFRKLEDGNVAIYDKLDIIPPIATTDNFVTVRIPYHKDFNKFSKSAIEIINGISPDTDPYGVEHEMEISKEYNVIHLSAVPKMHFTGMTFTVNKLGAPCFYPLSVMGKAVRHSDNSMKMPYSIYVDHAFIDGSHLSKFFETVESVLKTPS